MTPGRSPRSPAPRTKIIIGRRALAAPPVSCCRVHAQREKYFDDCQRLQLLAAAAAHSDSSYLFIFLRAYYILLYTPYAGKRARRKGRQERRRGADMYAVPKNPMLCTCIRIRVWVEVSGSTCYPLPRALLVLSITGRFPSNFPLEFAARCERVRRAEAASRWSRGWMMAWTLFTPAIWLWRAAGIYMMTFSWSFFRWEIK